MHYFVIPSFGIGIISSKNMKYKYGYWICIENDFTKLDAIVGH